MIECMQQAHIPGVVEVHLASFPGFFLSFLGPKFLYLYYESIVDYPDAIGYVYVVDGDVLGLVCGTVSPSLFYKYLLRTRWFRFALAALGAAFRKPPIVPRLLRAWTYPDQTPNQEDSATLTSIAVDPGRQNRGVGSQLLAAFLEELRTRGIKSVNLTTDQQDNDQVNAFYLAQGFRCTRTFVTPEGRTMNEYVLKLKGVEV